MNDVAAFSRRAGPALAALLLLAGFSPRDPGPLVIIGGGDRPAYMMERIVELAGGAASCRMAVIPMASADPLDVGRYQADQLEAAGCPHVRVLPFDSVTANHDSVVAVLDGATGIFFSGGDQNRLTAHMLGTRVLERVREIHRSGGVVAGTSAGAAIMSGIMITGDEAAAGSGGRSFATIREGNVVTAEGFGFVERAIIDQHFIARQRQNRLISLVLERPGLLGIGIDEATAIIVTDPDRFEVLGEGTVMVLDAADARGIGSDARGNLVAEGIIMHLLGSGQSFDMARRRVIPR